ncbi:MAG: hypothetical protein JO287_03350 [Pseudonocardiales bacterium]|nr:hypothetical protein [Pseudonocardiales bacterium]
MTSDVGSGPEDEATQWVADYSKIELSTPEILRILGRDVQSWDLSTRLTMRISPIFALTGFRHRVQKLAFDFDRARDLTRGLDLAGDLTRDLTDTSARDRARGLTRDLTGAGVRTHNVVYDLEHVRNLDLVRGRDLARELGLVCELAVDLGRTVDLARELAHARDRALGQAHVLGLTLTYGSPSVLALGVGLSFAHTLTLVRVRDREVYRALTVARDRALALDRALDHALDRNGTTKALVDLHHALSDVTDHDLRGIDLAGIALEGLRWSTQTRWPAELEDQIRLDSAEVAAGVFQVVGRGPVYASTQT